MVALTRTLADNLYTMLGVITQGETEVDRTFYDPEAQAA